MTTLFTFDPIYLHEIEKKTRLVVVKDYISPNGNEFYASLHDGHNGPYICDVTTVFGVFKDTDDEWSNSNEIIEISFVETIENIPPVVRNGIQELINGLDLVFLDGIEYEKQYLTKGGIFREEDKYVDIDREEQQKYWIGWMKTNGFINTRKNREENINKIIK